MICVFISYSFFCCLPDYNESFSVKGTLGIPAGGQRVHMDSTFGKRFLVGRTEAPPPQRPEPDRIKKHRRYSVSI